jgi:hypothetical protein
MKTVIEIKTLRQTANGVRTNVTVFPGTVAEVIETSSEWSHIRLKDAPGAPDGWILSSALSDAPPANIEAFVENCGAVAICVGIDFGAISSVTILPHHAARSKI